MPHKCIRVSEEDLFGSTYTKTGKVLSIAAFISAYITQKSQGLEGAVILFYIF